DGYRALLSFPTRRSSDLSVSLTAAIDSSLRSSSTRRLASAHSAVCSWSAIAVSLLCRFVAAANALDDADSDFSFTGEDGDQGARSEEHTSELQSRENLVC